MAINPVILGLAIQNRFSAEKKKLTLEIVNKSIQKVYTHLPDHGFESLKDVNTYLCGNKFTPALDQADLDFASNVVERSEQSDIEILSIVDPRYPNYLKAVKNPPSLIHIKGSIAAVIEKPGVSVVGTRDATLPGKEIAKRISMFLAEKGYTVISGLALGIDAAAHQGALAANGTTVAVLAHGLHKSSPKRNEFLGNEILDNDGAWVSEHPVGADPRREYFVPRNRIQIGLSLGSVIVEAEVKSGSITQANFCVMNRRALFAVVPDENTSRLGLLSNGTEFLVKEGKAIPLSTKKDYGAMIATLENVIL